MMYARRGAEHVSEHVSLRCVAPRGYGLWGSYQWVHSHRLRITRGPFGASVALKVTLDSEETEKIHLNGTTAAAERPALEPRNGWVVLQKRVIPGYLESRNTLRRHG